MDNEFKNYINRLKEDLDSYKNMNEFIDYRQEMYNLLTDILDGENAERESRLKICAAIAYFVTPFDIIPRQVYGPHGFIDDIYVFSYVINDLSEYLGWKPLEEAWRGNEELKTVLDKCQLKSKEILGTKADEILIHIGLK